MILEETLGLLCFAEITEFAKELHSEMEMVILWTNFLRIGYIL